MQLATYLSRVALCTDVAADLPTKMTRIRIVFTAIALFICLAVAVPAPAGLLYFTSSISQQDSTVIGEVRAGPLVVIRLRGTQLADIEARTQLVAERLTQQGLRGIPAQDIRTARLDSSYAIMAGDVLLVTVDKRTADLADARPSDLAEQWAQNLRRAFAPPYVCLDLAPDTVVPLGETRRIRYGGTYAGQLSASSEDPTVISVATDPEQQVLTINGLTLGSTRITIPTEPIPASFPVRCLPWAGTITHPIAAQLTTPQAPDEVMQAAILNALLANINAEPKASVHIGQLQRSFAGWQSAVQITGPGYLPRRETVNIGVNLISRPTALPQSVLVSNEPERVTGPGTLLREPLGSGESCRLLWHHVNDTASVPLTFAVRVVNTSAQPAKVFILGDEAGPSTDEIHSGHVAMYDFWRMLLASVGYVATVPAASAWQAYQCTALPTRIVSGVCQMTNIGPEAVMIEVVAQYRASDMLLVAVDTNAEHLSKLSEFRYDARQTAELRHQIGGAWSFLRIGKPSSDPDIVQLPGHYGVLYDITVKVDNARQHAATFELVTTAAGGAGRGVYLIDGQLIDTGSMRPYEEKLLWRGRVAAGASRSLPVQTIPQAGSNYPVMLVVRSFTR